MGRAGKAVVGTALALALAAALPARAAAGDREAALQPEQVRTVQRALNDLEYKVPLSGTWDARTQGAVRQFQEANGLHATGSLDDATARALGVDPSAVQPVAGHQPERELERDRAGRLLGDDPAADCRINNTVDCLPGE